MTTDPGDASLVPQDHTERSEHVSDFMERLLSSAHQVRREAAVGRPAGIAWSTLSHEEKWKLLRGEFSPEERKALESRAPRSIADVFVVQGNENAAPG